MKRLFCRLFHRRILWPTGEKYLCAVCLTPWYNSLQGDTKWYERHRPDWLAAETERIRAMYGSRDINSVLGGSDWFNELFGGGK